MTSISPIDDETAARFWARVDRSGGPDACWEWQGARNFGGHGHCRIAHISGAHRVAYAIAYGTPANGLQVVRHRCANPACCNPDHLTLGTHRENLQDMRARRRLGIAPGILFTYEDEEGQR